MEAAITSRELVMAALIQRVSGIYYTEVLVKILLLI